MHHKLLLLLCLLLAIAGAAEAKDKDPKGKESPAKEPAAKELSGMSIVGNDEVPKSLYIVPWKRSEMGAGASLNLMLTESAVPVDREEFTRQVDFYEAVKKKQ